MVQIKFEPKPDVSVWGDIALILALGTVFVAAAYMGWCAFFVVRELVLL